jgi:SAM-dependent methyltransferase
MTHGPDVAFWQARFESGQTPWDRGQAHPQLKAWLAAGLIRPGQRVAVPGCGSGHEVLMLAEAGIDVLGLDYAPAAVALVRSRLAQHGLSAAVEQADVLGWQPAAPLDLVYEQTCLCALHPDHWRRYADQLHAWLRPGGQLLALCMQAPRPGAAEGRIEGPPYHCDIHAMRALFPSERWDWTPPPYAATPHERGWHELALVLGRR